MNWSLFYPVKICLILDLESNSINQVNIKPNYPYPKKIAKVCFLVVLCQLGSTLQHTKSWTELKYGKVSNFDDENCNHYVFFLFSPCISKK